MHLLRSAMYGQKDFVIVKLFFISAKGDGPVGKVFGTHAWGPEFKPQSLHLKSQACAGELEPLPLLF